MTLPLIRLYFDWLRVISRSSLVRDHVSREEVGTTITSYRGSSRTRRMDRSQSLSSSRSVVFNSKLIRRAKSIIPTRSPSTWASKFPLAGGSRQSPVDIDTKKARSDTKAKPLQMRYAPDKVLRLINPGYGWKVDVDGEGSELSGGPLEGAYKLEQFHCHWGCTNEKGSEHTVDGRSFAGELHLVHWNFMKYDSFAEAASNPDGLAVLGIFLQVGDEHEELGKIASLLPQISFRGDSIPFLGQMDPAKLFPDERSYWTYQGSLTTPPCTESVTWLVFKKPIQVSENQLNLFRNLRCRTKNDTCATDDGLIINNFRPPLPLGNRELRECGSV